MISNKIFEFLVPGKVRFELGGSNKIGEEIKALGGKNVFISTDKGVLSSNLINGMIASLEKEGLKYTIYDEIEPNPSIEIVEKGIGVFDEKKCDFLVGVGGGSSMDTAKAVGILTANPEPLKQYEGANKVPNPVLPIIAIPTTAGTGSEVNGSTVLTDKSRKYKLSIRSTFLVPSIAILDPSLLRSLPQGVIAQTGMDALVHAIESYVSIMASPITEGLALESIKLVAENLRAFYANPENIEAASKMLVASTMAGISFANARLGYIHAIAHALGGYYNTAHGLTCAVLLPYAMEYSLISNPEKFARIAQVMGEKTGGLPSMESAKKAVEAVKALSKDVDLPQDLKQLGVKAEDIPQIAKNAVETGIQLSTPRKIDLRGIEDTLKAAL